MEYLVMKHLIDMIWIEVRKAARSRVPVLTALGALFMLLGIAFLLYVSKNPEVARNLGLISAKADLMSASATTWPAYLGLLAQMTAMGGFFLFCLAITWIFGREFSDHTLKDWLAVPVPRASILLAKFIVAAVWSLALSVEIYGVGLLMGALIQLPQGSQSVFVQGSIVDAVTACLVIALALPFAFFASLGRGYLLPMGMTILTAILANLLVVAGWGEYFPWAIPGLFTQGLPLPPASFWIVILTSLAGMGVTYLWWMTADQSR
jgi:ABC-2 type transport system permease protein